MQDTKSKQPVKKKTRSLKKKICFIFLEICLSLLLITISMEIFIRLLDPYGVSHFSNMPHYFSHLCNVTVPPRILEHRHDVTVNFNDFSITTNNMGFRGPHLPEAKAEGEYRLLFLGDSVLLGWGASEKDIFVTLAERELNELSEEGVAYRCINTGHNQYDTAQEAALLEELGDRLHPDAVILVYVNNDVVPTLKTYEALMAKAREAQENAPDTWTYHARQWATLKLQVLFKGIQNLKGYYFHLQDRADTVETMREVNAEVDAEGWLSSRDALLEIRDWCKARSLPFVVLIHCRPVMDDLPAEVPTLEPFLEEEGIPFFPFHFTREEMKMPLRHSASDAHSNALGHQILYRKMRAALKYLGLKTR